MKVPRNMPTQKKFMFPFRSFWGPVRASLVVLVVKNPPANAGDIRDAGSIPGSRRSSGGEQLTPVFCLENPMNRRPWWAAVHGVVKSQHDCNDLTHTQTC